MNAGRPMLAVARQEWVRLVPSMEFVRLKLHQVLHEAGETIKSFYFLNSGLGSVLTVLPDGKSVDVGLIGKEGMSVSPSYSASKPVPLES